jgi:hypothetical protein
MKRLSALRPFYFVQHGLRKVYVESFIRISPGRSVKKWKMIETGQVTTIAPRNSMFPKTWDKYNNWWLAAIE